MKSLVDEDLDYKPLGFFRHFAFIRFIWSELCDRTDEVKHLREKIEDLAGSQILTHTGEEQDNVEIRRQEVSSDSEDFYKRFPGETVEEFIDRVSTVKSKSKVVSGVGDLIDKARTRHIADSIAREEEASVTVSQKAINRIGSEIEKVKAS